jgi:hypothetical protein
MLIGGGWEGSGGFIGMVLREERKGLWCDRVSGGCGG